VIGFNVARGPNTSPSSRDEGRETAPSGELSGNGSEEGFKVLEANGPKTIDLSSLTPCVDCGSFEEVERVGPKIREDDESLLPALLRDCDDGRRELLVVGRDKEDDDKVVGIGGSLLLGCCVDFEANGPKIVPARGCDCGCCVLFEARGPKINPSLDN